LSLWQKKEQAKMSKLVRYSEAFKRQVVNELESGKHNSIECARRAYGITGNGTVPRWVRKYGREDLLPKIVRIETLKERDELKEARKRIRDLEAAVADAHIDHCLERAYFHVACERMGVDPNDFKKKNELTLSDMRRRQGRK
jgi:transposase-like protein